MYRSFPQSNPNHPLYVLNTASSYTSSIAYSNWLNECYASQPEENMSLNNKERKDLKSRAHHLKPVIRIGQKGISENLVLETELALEIHELIKVHNSAEDRDERKLVCNELAVRCSAEVVDQIGKTAILYRKKKKKIE